MPKEAHDNRITDIRDNLNAFREDYFRITVE